MNGSFPPKFLFLIFDVFTEGVFNCKQYFYLETKKDTVLSY